MKGDDLATLKTAALELQDWLGKFKGVFAHVYLATLGHTPFSYFRPMLTGWEDVE